jgi:carboxyl-terminal processing protease
MQDYNRAIIVGGNHTFGKGTVQNFAELDRMVPRKPADMKSLGALKMTIQKFYRVNGGSTQLKGVTPDIIFPDYYNYLDFGEKDMDYPMPWDEVPSVKYTKWIPAYNPKAIEESERKIIKQDTLLTLIHENGKRLKEIRDNTELPLNYDKYDELITKREESGKKYERIGKDTLGLVIRVLTSDLPKIEADTSAKARSDSWISDLKKDIYLYETTMILDDIKGKRED